jgi:plastocyanin
MLSFEGMRGEAKNYIIVILGVVVLLMGLVFVRNTSGGEDKIAGAATSLAGKGDTVQVTTVLQNFKYNPDTITVKRGQKVQLTIENRDNVLHGLHLPQFGIVDSTQPKSTKIVTFTAIKTATNGQSVPTCSQEHGETLTINVV